MVMPRANRFYLPGYAWHITHRCHKREFLLKFDKDKRRWVQWLFEAKKRYGLCVLNYTVTSNHVHLLIYENKADTIPKSLQLIAGRIGQEYNIRKGRKGAFWEDRYHATVISSDTYLIHCMMYIDLNMVRAGVVDHPKDWEFTGYHEIMNPKQRYSIINLEMLRGFFKVKTNQRLQEEYSMFVERELNKGFISHEPAWSQAVAVGDEAFIAEIQKKMGVKTEKRKVEGKEDHWLLHDPGNSYS
jgi:REP element-mobilizing transposase RayT